LLRTTWPINFVGLVVEQGRDVDPGHDAWLGEAAGELLLGHAKGGHVEQHSQVGSNAHAAGVGNAVAVHHDDVGLVFELGEGLDDRLGASRKDRKPGT
jgi:hypothetical protein